MSLLGLPFTLISLPNLNLYSFLGTQHQNARELAAALNQDLDFYSLGVIFGSGGVLLPTLADLDVAGGGAGNIFQAQAFVSVTFTADPSNPFTGLPIYADPGDGGGFRRLLFWEARDNTDARALAAIVNVQINQVPAPPVGVPPVPQYKIPLAWTEATAGDGALFLLGVVYAQLVFQVPPAALFASFGATAAARSAAPLTDEQKAVLAPRPDYIAIGRAAVAEARAKAGKGSKITAADLIASFKPVAKVAAKKNDPR
jgi:hypothetical protein